MKTFTNHILTFKDEQLIKDAIEIISNETIVHNNTDKNTFNICGNINVLLKTDHAEIETDSKPLVQLDDANKLLNFVLVETNKLKGISHLRDRGAYLSDLSFQDQKHIRRLSLCPFFGATPEAVYEKLVFGDMTPKEFKEEFDVSAKFITALRKANRKMIISSVIDEVTSNKKKGVAA